MSGHNGLSACECPICFSLLNGERVPMSLPCGHTVCQLCINDLLVTVRGNRKGGEGDESNVFPCPLCRKLIHRDSISLNVTLKDLIGRY